MMALNLRSKLIGGTLLIVGTSIGGGMLALPVSTAELGFGNSIFLLILCWLVMTSGALLVLEVNLRLPVGSNMISMAKATLGLPGQIIAWITYLFLLYTLLSAYISGGSDIFNALLQKLNLKVSPSFTAITYTLLFSLIVYQGIRSVDYVNRDLMLGKLGVYILLVVIISPHISASSLLGGETRAVTGMLMILITSFGFASIVPSLRDYFADDIPSLRRVIIFGSLIPLLCYIIWDGVIMGVIANNNLIDLMKSEHAASGLTTALSHSLNNSWINGFFAFFSSICMITAFLGVSLGLFDFLADGFKLEKKGKQGKYTLSLTFLPPLIIVLFYPGIYLQALSYAGICCIILLLLLPVLMCWQSRKKYEHVMIMVPGGKVSLAVLTVISFALLLFALYCAQAQFEVF